MVRGFRLLNGRRPGRMKKWRWLTNVMLLLLWDTARYQATKNGQPPINCARANGPKKIPPAQSQSESTCLACQKNDLGLEAGCFRRPEPRGWWWRRMKLLQIISLFPFTLAHLERQVQHRDHSLHRSPEPLRRQVCMRPGICCGWMTSLAPLSIHADPGNAKSICRQSTLAGEETIRGAFSAFSMVASQDRQTTFLSRLCVCVTMACSDRLDIRSVG